MSKETAPESANTLAAEPPLNALMSALLVDDEPGILRILQRGLQPQFGLIEVAADSTHADALLQRCHFDLIISDIRMPGRSGVEWIRELRQQGRTTPVIFITAYADLETALQAIRAGASDMLMKPFRIQQLLTAVDRCLEGQRLKRENFVLRRQLEQQYADVGLLGNSEAMAKVRHLLERLAPLPSPLLILGEPGTGKELAARALHQWSRRNGSFVAVNCTAINAAKLETELFGEVRAEPGGASRGREGLLAYASEGTLFFDEIGELPLALQDRFLRLLEDGYLGAAPMTHPLPLNLRIIAASNRNLAAEVEAGRFRHDLFYRLNTMAIELPPLRQRDTDVGVLAAHFGRSLAQQMGLPQPEYSAQELRALQAHAWPGNVRELKNVIERSLLLDLPPSACLVGVAAALPVAVPPASSAAALMRLEEVEKQHILQVLESVAGNKSAAAKILGVSRKTLERKTREWEGQP